jgi:tRNA threonylcarbamoyladenosine biosynthesis protein TsaB
MSVLAFDTATTFGAVCAVAPDGERRATARAGDVLELVDELVVDPAALKGIVVGTGPGSFTSIRIGLSIARSLAYALDLRVAGVSTLEAFAGGVPVLDARRGEVFTTGPRVCAPGALEVAGLRLVGDGAIRYRDLFEANGAEVPPDDDSTHRPDPLLLAGRAGPYEPAALVEPLYVREPDARPPS